jgi:hypothetical protein
MSYGTDQISEYSTDEKIIEALRDNPALIKFLESYPENWKEIVQKGIKVAKRVRKVVSEVKEIVSEITDAVEDVKESVTLVKKRKPTSKK